MNRAAICLAVLAALVSAASVFPAHAAERAKTALLSCDSSIAANFKPSAETKVLLVKAFKKGDAFPNPSWVHMFVPSTPTTAVADLCLVKLLVGPGSPGPVGAPSTSAGIGIEIWLPAKNAWNGRMHAIGGGGWSGSEESDVTKISGLTASVDLRTAPLVAGEEGAVTSTTDTGHVGGGLSNANGSFGMNPDGTINKALWNDFASRAIHLQAVMTKALAKAYYGAAPKYAYWDGSSGGGRQSMKLAQRFPKDFDGIIANAPAIGWTKFMIADIYPQIVIQRDLGGKYMTADQLNLVSNAAIAACDVVGGKHMGFILDNAACHYDPTRDKAVLCAADGGSNGTAACVTPKQALAINKIWYGMTLDGSVPDPAVDNGFGPLTGKHKYYGVPRGTSLLTLAAGPPFVMGTDMLAHALQDPRIATPSFRNAKANGSDGWKSFSYAQLAQAFDAGIALQPQFGDIDTDAPDLSAFKARGGKLIHVNSINDDRIPYLGAVDYYERVLAKAGSLPQVQSFYRLYLIPGVSHGPWNGTSNPAANPPFHQPGKRELYTLLTDWVEKGIDPGTKVLNSSSNTPVAKSLPMCAYPAKATYVGGDINKAGSYACR